MQQTLLAISEDTELHIEVKGSSGTSTTVELTANEVEEAAADTPHDSTLIVVDQINWTRSPTGKITTSGGRIRLWDEWTPDEERLTPTRYRYLLPPTEYLYVEKT